MIDGNLIQKGWLAICVSNLINRRDQRGRENKLLPQHQFSLPNIIDPDRYFSVCKLKNAGRKQKFGYALRHAVLTGNFYIESCSLHNS